MNTPKWWLRRRLRTAARLLRKGVINKWQYSALAIKLGYEIWGKPLTNETRLEQYPFGLGLANALGLKNPSNPVEYQELLKTYGPFNEAITLTLAGVVQPTDAPTARDAFNWNGDYENRAKATALRLNRFNRAAFKIQEWWSEQEHLFPLFTKITAFILGMVVGVVIGRLSH